MYIPLNTVQQVVSVVDELAKLADRAHFAESCLPLLSGLVPCDVVTYHERDLPSEKVHHLEFHRVPGDGEASHAGLGWYQATLSLAPTPDSRVIVTFSRSGRAFTDVEHDVLALLGIPMTSALRRRSAHRMSVLGRLDGHDEHQGIDGHDDLDSLDGHGTLTARERQIVGLVALGATNVAIAHELAVSPRTVAKHLEHIYRKLEVAGRAAAVARVLR